MIVICVTNVQNNFQIGIVIKELVREGSSGNLCKIVAIAGRILGGIVVLSVNLLKTCKYLLL